MRFLARFSAFRVPDWCVPDREIFFLIMTEMLTLLKLSQNIGLYKLT